MCLDCFRGLPEPAIPPPVIYDWDETDPPVTEPREPVTLDEDTAKALLRYDLARWRGR